MSNLNGFAQTLRRTRLPLVASTTPTCSTENSFLQVKQAFGVQPWIKRVKFVNKRFPATVEVEVEYRRPIAMVEVPAGMFEDFDEPGLLPVDVDGCLLPVELTEQEAAIYPWISGINTSPSGPPGNPWGDERVTKSRQHCCFTRGHVGAVEAAPYRSAFE